MEVLITIISHGLLLNAFIIHDAFLSLKDASRPCLRPSLASQEGSELTPGEGTTQPALSAFMGLPSYQ